MKEQTVSIKEFLVNKKDTSILIQFKKYVIHKGITPVVVGLTESYYKLNELDLCYKDMILDSCYTDSIDISDYIDLPDFIE